MTPQLNESDDSPCTSLAQIHDHLQLSKLVCGAMTMRKKLEVDTMKLLDYMRGKHRKIQEKVFKYFNARPELQTPLEILKDEHRELCMR